MFRSKRQPEQLRMTASAAIEGQKTPGSRWGQTTISMPASLTASSVSCVASVGGVSVEAEDRTGEAGNTPISPTLAKSSHGTTSTTLRADFFDSIDPLQTFLRPDAIVGARKRPEISWLLEPHR